MSCIVSILYAEMECVTLSYFYGLFFCVSISITSVYSAPFLAIITKQSSRACSIFILHKLKLSLILLLTNENRRSRPIIQVSFLAVDADTQGINCLGPKVM